MLKNYFYKVSQEIIRRLKKFFFLRMYRKDTPQDTWKFYNKMRYIYKSEFLKRENFSKSLEESGISNSLNEKGYVILNLSDISKKKEFYESIIKFRKKFDDINNHQNENSEHNSKKYLINYNFEFNNQVKAIADPFIEIISKYLGSLPILDTFQMWYSPNDNDELIGSKLVHRDGEDFKQIKIFIPIEEIKIENGPLHVIDKIQSEKIYKNLIKQNLIYRRNQKIDDKYIKDFNPSFNKILLNNDQCALVDTCACYHFGSRKSTKPRKLLFLHFTSAFSSKTPIFRNYDVEKKFYSEKDKLVYGLQKKTSNHTKKSKYLTV